MPGSSLYKVHLVWEKISRYWHFGNLAQFKYNLSQADKYLVESKTLFEYKQYLLAYKALKKSDEYFANVNPYLEKAKNEGKDITQKKNMLRDARLKHIETINYINTIVPKEFLWKPEKSSPTKLDIKDAIKNSLYVRMVNL